MGLSLINASNGSGEAVRASVTTLRSIGSAIINVDSAVNWPAKFIATSGTLKSDSTLDPATITVFAGHLTGSQITIDAYEPGYSDRGHAVGDVIVLKPTTAWADNIATALTIAHNDDGSLKTASVNTAGNLETIRSEVNRDFIVDGTGIWSVTSGLSGTMSAITAYIGGKRVTSAAISSHAFAASSDTYVALDNTGAITYSAVTSGGTSPTRPANAIWIALVRTSGSAIITFGQTPDPVNGLSCFDNLNNFPINPQRGSRVVGRQCGWGTITQGTSSAAVMWNGCQYLPFTGVFGRTYRFTMHESVIDSYTVSGSGGFFQWFFSNSQTKTVSSTMQVIRTPAVAGGCGADGTFEFVASYSGLQYLAIQWLSAPNVSGTLACERASSSAPAYYTVEEI